MTRLFTFNFLKLLLHTAYVSLQLMASTNFLYIMDDVYKSHNPLVRFVHWHRLEAIAGCIPYRKLKILDAGCGEGHLLELLHQKNSASEYYGVDETEVAIADAKKRCPFGTFHLGNIAQMPFPDGSFDIVIATEVLEHVIEYQQVITELKRVTKKGGSLIFTFPNEPLWTLSRFFLGRRPIKIPDHVNSFSPRMMAKTVDLPLIQQRNLPFRLPFLFSLGALVRFKK